MRIRTRAPRGPVIDTRPVWGTVIRIELRDHVDHDAIDAVWAWFERVDELFSTWRADSEVSRLARGELDIGAVTPDVREVLDRCEQLRRLSDGGFDVAFAAGSRVAAPGRCAIDPTGLVKGWAVDRAARVLTAAGAANFSINAGGDVLVAGGPATGQPWRVGIQHPWQRDRVAAAIGVTDAAVATSGAYERGHHVFDGRTGRVARGLASVTVVAGDLATADGLATAALALGADGMPWLAAQPDVDAMGITDARRVVKTARFDRLLVP